MSCVKTCMYLRPSTLWGTLDPWGGQPLTCTERRGVLYGRNKRRPEGKHTMLLPKKSKYHKNKLFQVNLDIQLPIKKCDTLC